MAFPTFSVEFELCCSRTSTALGTLTRKCDPNGRHYTVTIQGETYVLYTRNREPVELAVMPYTYFDGETLPRDLNTSGYS